jgi:hypothetical protein
MRRIRVRPRRRVDLPSRPRTHSGGPILSSSEVAALLAELHRGNISAAKLAMWYHVPIATIFALKDDLRRGGQ